jgi:dTDP-glucose 4,6-dehydratase
MADCHAVLHLAALVAIPHSYRSPDSYIDTNIRGTLNVVQAARDLGIERVIHTSTSEVYGTARFVPITEEHPLQGQSPYSASKIGADQLAMSFYLSFDTPVSIIRPFNTFGPRQSARAVIPSIMIQILSGAREIKLGSLHPTRDFSFVTDTVAGFMAAITHEAAIGQTINIGSGFEISIADTVSLIAEVLGVDVAVVGDEQRVRPAASEVERLWASAKKAESLLDWRPAYAGLDGFRRGLRETAAWFSLPANLALYKSTDYNT